MITTHKRLLLFSLTCLAIGFGWFASADANAASQRLVLTGSSTVAPLVGEIVRKYESMHPGVRIDVQTGGSSRGINDTRNGIADIGMVSRALKPNEKDLHAYTIALDGVSVILHASNPVSVLSKQQIADIYTGKITNWKSVGGADARITVVNKAEGRSTLELFLQYFQLKNSQIKPHIIIGDNPQGIKTITGNPHAVGYVSIGAAEYEAKRGAPIRLLALDGVDASVAHVHSGAFPLSRPLNLITSHVPQGLAQHFITFARSQQTHELVEAQYFVPISAE
ncbi:MAG: phosphate ABC transporter substrate-binding protein [Nitrosomonas sp.]|nr:phosphate ABC transporter substrate-binding protein [Nitrosomonas sp.]